MRSIPPGGTWGGADSKEASPTSRWRQVSTITIKPGVWGQTQLGGAYIAPLRQPGRGKRDFSSRKHHVLLCSGAGLAGWWLGDPGGEWFGRWTTWVCCLLFCQVASTYFQHSNCLLCQRGRGHHSDHRRCHGARGRLAHLQGLISWETCSWNISTEKRLEGKLTNPFYPRCCTERPLTLKTQRSWSSWSTSWRRTRTWRNASWCGLPIVTGNLMSWLFIVNQIQTYCESNPKNEKLSVKSNLYHQGNRRGVHQPWGQFQGKFPSMAGMLFQHLSFFVVAALCFGR